METMKNFVTYLHLMHLLQSIVRAFSTELIIITVSVCVGERLYNNYKYVIDVVDR